MFEVVESVSAKLGLFTLLMSGRLLLFKPFFWADFLPVFNIYSLNVESLLRFLRNEEIYSKFLHLSKDTISFDNIAEKVV